MPKFKTFSTSGQLEQWLLYLEYEGKPDDSARKVVKEVMKMNPDIKSTHKRYKQFTSSKEMRDLYEARLKYKRDVASLIDSGREEGKLIDKRETLKRLMDKKFGLSGNIEKLILSENNPEILDKALDILLFTNDCNEVLDVLRNQ